MYIVNATQIAITFVSLKKKNLQNKPCVEASFEVSLEYYFIRAVLHVLLTPVLLKSLLKYSIGLSALADENSEVS